MINFYKNSHGQNPKNYTTAILLYKGEIANFMKKLFITIVLSLFIFIISGCNDIKNNVVDRKSTDSSTTVKPEGGGTIKALSYRMPEPLDIIAFYGEVNRRCSNYSYYNNHGDELNDRVNNAAAIYICIANAITASGIHSAFMRKDLVSARNVIRNHEDIVAQSAANATQIQNIVNNVDNNFRISVLLIEDIVRSVTHINPAIPQAQQLLYITNARQYFAEGRRNIEQLIERLEALSNAATNARDTFISIDNNQLYPRFLHALKVSVPAGLDDNSTLLALNDTIAVNNINILVGQLNDSINNDQKLADLIHDSEIIYRHLNP
jgi:hypothetical protein